MVKVAMSTPFLDALKPVLPNLKAGTVAQNFMRIKGLADLKPLGYVGVGDCWYIYYFTGDTLIEMEISLNRSSGEYARRVSSAISDREGLRKQLGDIATADCFSSLKDSASDKPGHGTAERCRPAD